MFISVQLTPASSKAFQSGSVTSQGFQNDLAYLGVDLQPLHPGTNDPELSTHFFANVNETEANTICARLSESPHVAAAYAKPEGSAPSDLPA
jgi:hypothetical protein